MRNFFKFWSYYLPIPLFLLMLVYWINLDLESYLLSFVFVLPVLYGYITPYIATTILKKWRFVGGVKIGEIYYHQGFKIASHLILWLSIALIGHDLKKPIEIIMMIKLSFMVALLNGFVIWIHDIYALRFNVIEMNNKMYLSGRSAEEIAFKFAPATFFTLGFFYSMCVFIFNKLLLSGVIGSVIEVVVSIVVSFIIINLALSLVYKRCELFLNRT